MRRIVFHAKAFADSIYTNPVSGVCEALPRHTEIKRHLARSICRRLGVDVPKGAWFATRTLTYHTPVLTLARLERLSCDLLPAELLPLRVGL